MNENINKICEVLFSIYIFDENQKKEVYEKVSNLSEDELKKLIKVLIEHKEKTKKLNSEFKKNLETKLTSLKEYKERKEAFNEAENLINNI